MGKAVLVIDMPQSCNNCDFCYYSDGRFPSCQLKFRAPDTCMEKPDWCPLKPMPKHIIDFGGDDDYADGYNTCIDEIIGDSV